MLSQFLAAVTASVQATLGTTNVRVVGYTSSSTGAGRRRSQLEQSGQVQQWVDIYLEVVTGSGDPEYSDVKTALQGLEDNGVALNQTVLDAYHITGGSAATLKACKHIVHSTSLSRTSRTVPRVGLCGLQLLGYIRSVSIA